MVNKPNRTAKGNVTQAARNKHGDKSGAFPVFDQQSAEAAINLRGHADDPSKILDKVARYANKVDNAALKHKVSEARKTDRDTKRQG